MPPLEENSAFGSSGAEQGATENSLPLCWNVREAKPGSRRIDTLREALRENLVSFPSQVPTFSNRDRPDVQRKVVQLYFILGWSSEKIAPRYGLSCTRVQQILNAWMSRAMELGYIQSIPQIERTPPDVDLRPTRGAVSRMTNNESSPEPLRSDRRPSGSEQIATGRSLKRSPRPRRRFENPQIAVVLLQLQAGRTVAEVADEVGASRGSIYKWREHNRSYRDGNGQVNPASGSPNAKSIDDFHQKRQ
jgi:transposase-like protein